MMKISKTLVYALIALPTLLLQSCLKDDKDIFGESPSARMEEYLDEAQQTLVGSQYGWALDYYPESSQSYGGFSYTVQFTKDTATVRFENRPSAGTESSLYAMKKNDGPVLSFDNYNSFLHYFATPTSDMVEGYNGDFEFVIDSIGQDVVKVHGTRNLNTLYFRRLTEPSADYMNKVTAMSDAFQLAGADVTVNGQAGRIELDRDARQIEFTVGNSTEQVAYCITDTGLRFYKPVTIAGTTINQLAYDDANMALSGDGVATTKGYVDPATVTSLIGGIGSDDESFSRTFRGLSHLDQFTITSDQPWVNVRTNAANGTITVSADANTTGAMRGATVTVSNGNYSSTFSVTQCNLSDLLGTYTIQYYDNDNAVQQKTATLAQTSTGVTLSFEMYSGITLTFPGTFDQSRGAVLFPQLQNIGRATASSTGTTYYLYNLYAVTSSGSAILNPNIDMPMYFRYDSRYGTYAQFTGTPLLYNGESIGYNALMIMVMGSESQTITSQDDFVGYFELISNGILIKNQASASAKPFEGFVPKRLPSKALMNYHLLK